MACLVFEESNRLWTNEQLSDRNHSRLNSARAFHMVQLPPNNVIEDSESNEATQIIFADTLRVSDNHSHPGTLDAFAGCTYRRQVGATVCNVMLYIPIMFGDLRQG